MTLDRRHLLQALAAGSASLPAMAALAADQPLLLFAAASLKEVLDEIAQAWAARLNRPVPRIAYGASGTLVRQIEAGAPADLFVSADRDWMDQAAERALIKPGTRVDLVGNRLVLVALKGAIAPFELGQGVDLAALLKGGRLALGHTGAVPAGRYGKTALERLGAWEGLRHRLAETENVRVALLLVARGEAPLGIVFASDAMAEPRVSVVATFPAELHPPIVYPAAVTATSRHPAAMEFLAHLQSDAALTAFLRHGFLRLGALGRPPGSLPA